MNISSYRAGISAAPVANNHHAASKQRMADFKSLATALDSGDSSSAQTAFEAVSKNIQNDPRIAKSGKSEQIDKDLTALGDAIKSGNTDAAKKAFTTLAQDLKSLHRGGHHHRVDNDGDKDDTAGSSLPPVAGTVDATTPPPAGTLDAIA